MLWFFFLRKRKNCRSPDKFWGSDMWCCVCANPPSIAKLFFSQQKKWKCASNVGGKRGIIGQELCSVHANVMFFSSLRVQGQVHNNLRCFQNWMTIDAFLFFLCHKVGGNIWIQGFGFLTTIKAIFVAGTLLVGILLKMLCKGSAYIVQR